MSAATATDFYVKTSVTCITWWVHLTGGDRSVWVSLFSGGGVSWYVFRLRGEVVLSGAMVLPDHTALRYYHNWCNLHCGHLNNLPTSIGLNFIENYFIDFFDKFPKKNR